MSTGTSSDRSTTDAQRWDAVAARWGARLDWTERHFAPLTTWFQQHLIDRRRVLDVACGAGYPSRASAIALGPRGRVVATDISAHMIDVAADRARTMGLENLAFMRADAHSLPFVEGTFDLVTNAYGLMFCRDPLRALTEAHRVLEMGASIAVVVWDEPWKSPFFSIIREVAAANRPPREPRAPGAQRSGDPSPLRLDSPDRLASLLEKAGFSNVSVESVSMTIDCDSAREYVQVFTDLAWRSQLGALSPSEAERFHEDVAAAVRPFTEDGRVRLVATSLRASAHK
jgi:enediyne biosynthesis protein CalE5